MSEGLNTSSKYISKVLERIYGTEDAISCVRALTDACTSFITDGVHVYLERVIGSNADGFMYGEMSDCDDIYIHQNIRVVFSDQKASYSHPGNYIRAIFEPQTSGYAMLELITYNSSTRVLYPLIRSAIYYKNRIFISSSTFLEMFDQHSNLFGKDSEVCGPSLTKVWSDNLSLDSVICFPCDIWPNVADEWIYRKRRYSWPSFEMIRFVESNGCMFVAIGEYSSPHKFLEWRLSFALSEKALVRTFNFLQFKLYGLMKLIQRYVCSNYKNVLLNENIITSYHIKTIMFWVVEQTPATLWVDTNLLMCLRMCILFLKNCLKGKFLPHYFLPNCNLFKKNRAYDVDKLIEDLHLYSNNMLLLLMRIKMIKNILFEFNMYRCCFSSMNPRPICTVVQFRGALSAMRAYSIISPYGTYETMHLCKIILNSIKKLTDCEYSITYKLLLYSAWSRTTNDMVCYNNKSNYMIRRKYKNISLWGTHIDLTTGWLKLASYYYVVEQYHRAEQLLTTALRQFSRAVCFLNFTMNNGIKLFLNHLFFSKPWLSFKEDMKHMTSGLVPFFQHDMYPQELDIDINTIECPLVIPPLPYAYFLKFLCSWRCHGVSQHLDVLLHDLELVVQDTQYRFRSDGVSIFDVSFTLLNMLGICHQIIGDVGKASYYYKQSKNKNDTSHCGYTEAANLRLQLLEIQNNPE